MGSSTIMVIFLGPPADKHTGTQNPDRTNKIREKKKEREEKKNNPMTFTWQKWWHELPRGDTGAAGGVTWIRSYETHAQTFCTGLCWLPYPMQVTMVSGIHTDSRMEPGRLGMSLCRALAQHEQVPGFSP